MRGQNPPKREPFFARRMFKECPVCGDLYLSQHLNDHVAAHYRLEVTLVERFPQRDIKKKAIQPEDPFAVLGGKHEGTAA